jgi:drug/metabolite transporter (DMT)-like permease
MFATRPLTPTPMPSWVAPATLVGIAFAFGSNHVAARLAFDHGVSVLTAVAVRSTCIALVVLGLVMVAGVSIRVSRLKLGQAAIVGALLATQSYCLYSAVARLPVAVALLVFNIWPILVALLSWLFGGERPARATLIAMPVIFCGLALALDAVDWVGRNQMPTQDQLAGIGFSLGAALSFASGLLLTQHWLGAMDGRLRSFFAMVVIAIMAYASALAGDGLKLPVDAAGWTGLALLTLLYGAGITVLFTVLPRIGAVNNSPFLNLEPIAAMIVAWLALGQTAEPVQIAGAMLVVGSIIYLSIARR